MIQKHDYKNAHRKNSKVIGLVEHTINNYVSIVIIVKIWPIFLQEF